MQKSSTPYILKNIVETTSASAVILKFSVSNFSSISVKKIEN